MAILFTKNLKVEFGSKYSGSDGRILLCNIQMKDKKISLASIYAPTKNKPKFFDNVFFSILSNFSQHDVVLTGYWNLVLNDQLNKDGGPVHTNSA